MHDVLYCWTTSPVQDQVQSSGWSAVIKQEQLEKMFFNKTCLIELISISVTCIMQLISIDDLKNACDLPSYIS